MLSTNAIPCAFPPQQQPRTPSTRYFMHLGNILATTHLPKLRLTEVPSGPKHAEIWTISIFIFIPFLDGYGQQAVGPYGPVWHNLMYVAEGCKKQEAKDKAARDALTDGLGIDINTLFD